MRKVDYELISEAYSKRILSESNVDATPNEKINAAAKRILALSGTDYKINEIGIRFGEIELLAKFIIGHSSLKYGAHVSDPEKELDHPSPFTPVE